MDSNGAVKQVDPRSAVLRDTTYNDGSRYQVGMLWAEDESSLPNNNFSALVQIKLLGRRRFQRAILQNDSGRLFKGVHREKGITSK